MDTTYTIEINELQRRIITSALQALNTNANSLFSKKQGSGAQAHGTEYEEYEVLLMMFEQLPTCEKEHPNVLHGFTI